MTRRSRDGIDEGSDLAHVAAQENGRSSLIAGQLGFSRYLTTADRADPGSRAPEVSFSSVSELWQAVASSRLHVFSGIVLDEVQLTEWVPISPGLSASDGARRYLDAVRPIAYEKTGLSQTVAVYTPDHKEAFLRAGYGCVRFGPHGFGGGPGDLWLLGATTTSHAHDGFPVALTGDQYREVIWRIRESGSLRCALVGRLEWLPDRFVSSGGDDELRTYRGPGGGPSLWFSRLPRVFLRVREVRHLPLRRRADPVTATMAVSFIGRVREQRNFYSAFVSFDPGRHESVQDAGQWLRSAYIRERYDGHVVTDCDEQFPSSDASLSLEKVMSGQIDLAALYQAVYEADDDVERYAYSREQKIAFMRHAVALAGGSVELVFGDKYTVGAALAVGSRAVAIGGSIVSEAMRSGIELTALATDFARLRSALSPSDPHHATVYFALAEAEDAAHMGDLNAVGDPLARARDWILENAEGHRAYLALEAARRVSP